MTDTKIPAEPDDKAFVVWFDPNNDPYAIFYRADQYADYEGDMARWLNTDQYAAAVEVMTWNELCNEMKDFDGPHLLTLDRSDAPAVAS